MIQLRNFLFIFMVLAAALGAQQALAQEENTQKRVEISLIPEFSELTPGMPLIIAIKQDIEEGWHTYWRNPGDSGSAPRIDWILPDEFETATLHWPVPHRITVPPLTNYGYEGSAIFVQEIWTPRTAVEGPMTLKANVDILVCKEICIPEYHELSLTINDGRNEDNSVMINEAYNSFPVDVKWDSFYYVDEATNDFVISMSLDKPKLIANENDSVRFEIVPHEWGIIDNTADTKIKLEDDPNSVKHRLILRKARGDRPITKLGEIQTLITHKQKSDGHLGAIRLTVPPDETWLAAAQAKEAQAAIEKSTAPQNLSNTIRPPSIGLAQALLFALLGGIILNLMPCVFPVLSMKALSLVKMSEKDHSSTRMHGLSYTAGIMISFLVIAGILIALQTAGAQIGWGFQLQNPLVVLMLAYLLFMVGLSLSGFYEISGSFTNVGAGLGKKEGVTESFFTGVLATIVATPCTAPFMGVAMGFALTQPAAIGLSVFLALGFGLALPYLLLSFFPALRAFLPKPGNWMVIFRELLAFPIYASVAWLIWVYSMQTGTLGLLYALSGFVGISFAVWIFRYTPSEGAGKLALRGLAIIVLLTVLAMTVTESLNASPEHMEVSDETAYFQPYTPETYKTALAGDKPVFTNMTAAWCVSCKVNEHVALNKDVTRETFKENDVVYLKGDWTNQDPDITSYLSGYGRNGVPLYVFYGPRDQSTGKRPDPVVLPQLLTTGTITKLFNQNGDDE